MSTGCNQHRHQPGCGHPQASRPEPVISFGRWRQEQARETGIPYDPVIDDHIAGELEELHRRFMAYGPGNPLPPVTRTDRLDAASMPPAEQRELEIRFDAIDRIRASRRRGDLSPITHEEWAEHSVAAYRARLAREEAERLPEVHLDLMGEGKEGPGAE